MVAPAAPGGSFGNQDMSAAPLTVIAIITAKEGQEAALRALQEKLVAETRTEDGCLRYELNQSLDDGRILIFVEIWETEEKWRAHIDGAALANFAAAGGGALIAEKVIHRMAQVA